jgi:hypothetical protein
MTARATSLAMFAAFLIVTAPLALVGKPQSPALEQLQAAGAVPDIAIIGDSRAHVGISPRALLAELAAQGVPGLSAWNFAVDGTDVLHHWAFARAALLSGPRVPRVIIWAVNPLQFDDGRRNNRLEQLALGDLPGLALARSPLELLLDVFTQGVFRPWAHRPLFKTMLSDYSERLGIRTLPLQQRVLGLTQEQERLSRTYVDRGDGWVPFYVLDWADRFKRGAKSYEGEYAGLKLGRWQLELARDLVKRCEERGVKLVAVETPVAPWFRDHLARLPVHQEWRKRIAKAVVGAGAAFYVHAGIFAGTADRAYGDPGHMPEALALRYSTALADAVLDGGALGAAPAHAALTGDL